MRVQNVNQQTLPVFIPISKCDKKKQEFYMVHYIKTEIFDISRIHFTRKILRNNLDSFRHMQEIELQKSYIES